MGTASTGLSLAVHSSSLFHGTLAQVFGWLIIELNWETILTEK